MITANKYGKARMIDLTANQTLLSLKHDVESLMSLKQVVEEDAFDIALAAKTANGLITDEQAKRHILCLELSKLNDTASDKDIEKYFEFINKINAMVAYEPIENWEPIAITITKDLGLTYIHSLVYPQIQLNS